jgi:hypothetical protein
VHQNAILEDDFLLSGSVAREVDDERALQKVVKGDVEADEAKKRRHPVRTQEQIP